ncbi:MAG TPA: efflux transporter outer membrane subunit [Steroidobacteraceae bacterium]|nr:efflux transporter outer membrane subunit [Steroidobacteraceae bacterium]
MRYRRVVTAALSALIAGCAVGPNYRRPAVDVGTVYKEASGWKPSEPADALHRGPWWTIFNDPLLDALQRRVDVSNETIQSAGAAVRQARALVGEAEAGFWPTLAADIGRQRTTSLAGSRTGNSAGVAGSWNLDLWGQVRRSAESSRASAEASRAALAGARLSVHAELAVDYFALRAQDQQQILLNDAVAAERASLAIVRSRYRFGVAAKADVVSAQTQLLANQAQQVNAGIQRALLEHAIAVLLGEPPSEFSLSAASMPTDVPTLPAGLPSALLERRPDVAAAERRMAAANAQIGVARAAFFPALTLSASDDYAGGAFSQLIRASNQVWAFGPAITQALFAGGLHRAQAAAARAAYQASVDDYRQTVLSALQQVEDELATLRILEKQAVIEEATVKAAQEAMKLTLSQYQAGTVPYSSVIAAQTTLLGARETALSVSLNRLTASVTMIEALGGGWDAAHLNQRGEPSASRAIAR